MKPKNALLFFILMLYWGFLHLFCEWIFLSTSFSFLNTISFTEKIKVLILSLGVFWPPIVLFSAIILFFSFLAKRYSAQIFVVTWNMLLAITLFLLVDNFTFNVLKFNLQSTHGWSKIIYIVLYFALLIGSIQFFKPLLSWWSDLKDERQKRVLYTLGSSLFPIFLLLIYFNLNSVKEENFTIDQTNQNRIKKPTILLIAMDGVEADYLPFYGYAYNTAPNLNNLANKSLIGENSFVNSGNTWGSSIALLTGRSPENTKVSLHVVTQLQGDDRRVHFLTILNQLQYQLFSSYFGYNKQFYQLKTNTFIEWWVDHGITKDFCDEVTLRVLARIDHLLGMEKLKNADLELDKQKRFELATASTKEKIELAKNFIIKNKETPFLLHFHFMLTHIGVNQTTKKQFSKGLVEDEKNWKLFYMDAIRESDEYIGELIQTLKQQGLWDQTVLVFYSDHGRNWNPRKRVPLLIHFPHDEFKGRIAKNIQLLDIPSTLIDYMNLPKPEWISGISLLSPNNIPLDRPIYSVTGKSQVDSYWFEYGMVQGSSYHGWEISQGIINEKIEGYQDENHSLKTDPQLAQQQLITHFTQLNHRFNRFNIQDILYRDGIEKDEKEKIVRRINMEKNRLAKEDRRRRQEKAERLKRLAEKEKRLKRLKEPSS